MADEQALQREFKEAVSRVVTERGADIFLYSGKICPEGEEQIRNAIRGLSAPREKALLLLTTFGGSGESGFRIARLLQDTYTHVTAVVDSVCKSAGTLIVCGCDDLAMSDAAELGPLDIQMAKQDEVLEMTSGLSLFQTFEFCRGYATRVLQRTLLELRQGSRLQVTTKTALEVATNLSVALVTPILAQVDPIRLGELFRANRIGLHYAERLQRGNLQELAASKLTTEYPSHECVIDKKEARRLFQSVTDLTPAEEALVSLFREDIKPPLYEEESVLVLPLSKIADELPAEDSTHEARHDDGPIEGRVAANSDADVEIRPREDSTDRTTTEASSAPVDPAPSDGEAR